MTTNQQGKLIMTDLDRTKHPQYDGLSFIECRLLDQRQAEEREAEEQRIKEADRKDWRSVLRLVSL
jgi:hypothetical protein